MKKNAFYLSAIMLCLLVISCRKTIPQKNLVMAIPDYLMMSLVFIAQIEGYFEDENLTVEMIYPSSGKDAITALLSGEADVGGTMEYPLAKKIYEGADVQILTTIYRSNESSKLIARKDHDITKIQDLIGKRIACTLNTNTEYILSMILTENGMSDDQIQLINTPPGDMVSSLVDKKVDAVITWNPHLNNIIASFNSEELLIFQSYTYTEISVLATTSEVLIAKKEAINSLTAALVRADDYALMYPEEALKLITSFLKKQSPEILKKDWSNSTFSIGLDNVLLTSLKNEALWFDRKKGSPGLVPDFNESLYTEALMNIRKNSVTIGDF